MWNKPGIQWWFSCGGGRAATAFFQQREAEGSGRSGKNFHSLVAMGPGSAGGREGQEGELAEEIHGGRCGEMDRQGP